MIWVLVWPDLDDPSFSQAFPAASEVDAGAMRRVYEAHGSYVEVLCKTGQGRLPHSPRNIAAFKRAAGARALRAAALRSKKED